MLHIKKLMGMHNKGTYARVLTYAYTRIDIRIYTKYESIIRVCVVRIYLSCTVTSVIFAIVARMLFRNHLNITIMIGNYSNQCDRYKKSWAVHIHMGWGESDPTFRYNCSQRTILNFSWHLKPCTVQKCPNACFAYHHQQTRILCLFVCLDEEVIVYITEFCFWLK